MHCVFHYVSAYLVLSTAVLLALGIGINFQVNTTLLARFIAINYAIFAITQIIIALTSKIPSGIAKLFQWMLFIVVAVLAWVGA